MAQNTKFNQLTTFDDFKEICRVCMCRSDAMKSLFHSESTFIEEIEFCTGKLITENVNLPSSICLNCQIKLTVAHKFKRTCISSEDNFNRLLQDLAKNEAECEESKSNDFCVKEEIDDDYFIEDLTELEIKKIKAPEPTETIRIPKPTKRKCTKLYCTICDIYFKCSKDSLEHQKAFHKGDLLKEEKVDINDDDYYLHKDLKESKLDSKQIKIPRIKKKPKPKPTKGKFRKLYCISCDIHFKCRKDNLEHQEKYHKEDQKWVCEMCGKLYKYHASYYSHIRSHQKPNHACDQCEYRCVNKFDMIKHLRMHSGEKLYQCHLCPNRYCTSSGLRSHHNRSHARTRAFVCEQCGRRFFEKQKLKRHHDTHFNIKRHECEVCHAYFSRRCQWRIHLQKQHNVFTPRMRPGPQKADVILKNIPTVFYK